MLTRLVHTGQASRVAWDRRAPELETGGRFTTFAAHIFEASYGPDWKAEYQVNLELGDMKQCAALAAFYAKLVGRLPGDLLRTVTKVTIHAGNYPPGVYYRHLHPVHEIPERRGGLLIHHDWAMARTGSLAVSLLHEAVHLDFGPKHKFSPEWKAAQEADGAYITDYAKRKPIEDFAESYVVFYGLRYRTSRMTPKFIETVTKTIPNRIAYFDRLLGFR